MQYASQRSDKHTAQATENGTKLIYILSRNLLIVDLIHIWVADADTVKVQVILLLHGTYLWVESSLDIQKTLSIQWMFWMFIRKFLKTLKCKIIFIQNKVSLS